MVNPLVGDIFGPYTGHDAKRLLDTFHGSPLQDRAVTRFVTSEVEQRLQRQLNDRLKAADAELTERADLLDDLAIEYVEDIKKVTRQLKSGRLTAAEGRKEIARLGTAKRELSERVEQLRHDEESLALMAEMTPEDYEQEYLATTPALRRQLPILTPDMLNQP